MSVSTSRLAYTDCYEVFDRALLSATGIRLPMASMDVATNFRMRMHQARKIDRQDNLKTYPDDHPMHGQSQYDKYTVRLLTYEDGTWLHVEPRGAGIDLEAIEDIPEGFQAPTALLPASEPVRQLESPEAVQDRIRRRV